MIVPDDLWKELSGHVGRAAHKLGRFIQTHPEQGKCIAPTGDEMLRLRALVRALTKANKDEKKGKS